MSDEEFLNAFFNCELGCLSHEDHIRAAWLVLRKQTLHAALQILSEAFRDFARSKDKPGVYHETITWSFIILIHERMHHGGAGRSWQEFLQLNPDLAAGKSVLEHLYGREQLESDVARKTFVLPDFADRLHRIRPAVQQNDV